MGIRLIFNFSHIEEDKDSLKPNENRVWKEGRSLREAALSLIYHKNKFKKEGRSLREAAFSLIYTIHVWCYPPFRPFFFISYCPISTFYFIHNTAHPVPPLLFYTHSYIYIYKYIFHKKKNVLQFISTILENL